MFALNDECISQSFKNFITEFDKRLSSCPDIMIRKVYLKDNKIGYFIYIDGLVDIDLVQRDFVNPIVNMSTAELNNEKNLLNLPLQTVVPIYDLNSIINNLFMPCTIFIADGLNHSFSCPFRKFEKRNISETTTEKNVRGAHEGFIESLPINLSILRRKIKNPSLKFKSVSLGTETNQSATIAYIENIANPALINTLEKKISAINFDGLIGIGYIQQFITDFPNSIFPQYLTTERPDKAVAALLEGRLLILLDGTPVALIAPVSFFSFFQSPDDYNSSWVYGSFFRLVRLFSLFFAVFLPGLYIAIISFHYYVIPLPLLIPLSESIANVPFPPIIEALIMELSIEMIIEGAIRLPTYIGTTIGVVGGLILGQAAVQAGIVSNVMIIVIAITSIASFTIPIYEMGLTIRLARLAVMLSASTFGMTGIYVISMLLIANLVTIESLGQPYFQPLAPFKVSEIKDAIIRAPIKFLRKRTDIAKPQDDERGTNNE